MPKFGNRSLVQHACQATYAGSHVWLSNASVPAAGKMYIQDKVEEYADEVFDLLDKGVSLLYTV